MLWLADNWVVSHLMDVEPIYGWLGENLLISKQVVGLFLATALLLCVFIPFGRALKKDPIIPRGRFVNMFEVITLFIRDEVVRPFLGKSGDRYLPVLWTFFYFVLFCNLLGLLPLWIPTPLSHHGEREVHWFGTLAPTGFFAVTGTLAIIAGLWWHGLGIKEQGVIAYIKNIVPGGLPPVLIPMLFVIEVFGHVIKIVALAIRLWANMLGGHAVLYLIIGLIFTFGYAIAPISVAAGIAIYMLEIFVAFLQAYVFTFLVTVFLGMALHPDH